jgi:CHAT domain-containing protein
MYTSDYVGPQTNFGKKKPLVFLNSCQSAVGSISLNYIDSWGRSFMRHGASAFIGSMWSVNDEGAVIFMKAFYTNLLNGQLVSEAVRLARQEIRKLPGLTWLSYTVYCNPQAKYAGKPGSSISI